MFQLIAVLGVVQGAMIQSGIVPMLRTCEKGNLNQRWTVDWQSGTITWGTSTSCLGVVTERLDSKSNATNAVLVPCTSRDALVWSVGGYPGPTITFATTVDRNQCLQPSFTVWCVSVLSSSLLPPPPLPPPPPPPPPPHLPVPVPVPPPPLSPQALHFYIALLMSILFILSHTINAGRFQRGGITWLE